MRSILIYNQNHDCCNEQVNLQLVLYAQLPIAIDQWETQPTYRLLPTGSGNYWYRYSLQYWNNGISTRQWLLLHYVTLHL